MCTSWGQNPKKPYSDNFRVARFPRKEKGKKRSLCKGGGKRSDFDANIRRVIGGLVAVAAEGRMTISPSSSSSDFLSLLPPSFSHLLFSISILPFFLYAAAAAAAAAAESWLRGRERGAKTGQSGRWSEIGSIWRTKSGEGRGLV